MRRRLAAETGQALVMTVVFLVVLVGATALTIDFGAWYRQQRQAQATADAAALAGAQALPNDPAGALALTEHYAAANGGGIGADDISFRSDYMPDDTVVVHATSTSPSFFARLFSVGTVTVHATAAARAAVPSEVYGAAPIVVDKFHPDLTGAACGQTTPCFGDETTIYLGKRGIPGAFGLLDFDQSSGTTGDSTLASWIANGYGGYLPLGDYDSDPGAKFNALVNALGSKLGGDLLFPVYDGISGQGSTAPYNIVGWVAFHLDCVGQMTGGACVQDSGSQSYLTGYFTSVVWDGLQSQSDQHEPDYGLYSVSLVN